MDEPLKVQGQAGADSPSGVVPPLVPQPSAPKPAVEQSTQLKQWVAEALDADTNLTRIREINQLVTAFLSAQLKTPSQTSTVSAESALSMRQLLRQRALDSYREEYKELSEVWKALETKAQGTVTIAGIFIAAAFTFAKDLAATRLDYYGNLFLGAAIILLIPAIICSVLVLWKRTVQSIPSAEDIEWWADLIRDTPDNALPDRICSFLDQQSIVWKETVASSRDAIERKAELLLVAQVLLLLAIGAASVVTLKLIRV